MYLNKFCFSKLYACSILTLTALYTKYQEKSAGVLSPSWWFGRKDEAESRQGVASVSPLLVAFVVGVAYSVLLLVAPLINPPERPKLENDPLCGIPTGGQV